MNLENKMHSVLIEYSLRKGNTHIGSGLGGNVEYFMYLQYKDLIISSDVNNVAITDKSILWNPDFLLKSKNEIRKVLDPIIEEKIKKEEFKSSISEDPFKINLGLMHIDESIKNLDIESILLGGPNLIDMTHLDFNNELYLCMRVCAKFAEHLDNGQDTNKYCKPVTDILNKCDIRTVLLSLRTQLSLERIVNYNLDENKEFHELLKVIDDLAC